MANVYADLIPDVVAPICELLKFSLVQSGPPFVSSRKVNIIDDAWNKEARFRSLLQKCLGYPATVPFAMNALATMYQAQGLTDQLREVVGMPGINNDHDAAMARLAGLLVLHIPDHVWITYGAFVQAGIVTSLDVVFEVRRKIEKPITDEDIPKVKKYSTLIERSNAAGWTGFRVFALTMSYVRPAIVEKPMSKLVVGEPVGFLPAVYRGQPDVGNKVYFDKQLAHAVATGTITDYQGSPITEGMIVHARNAINADTALEMLLEVNRGGPLDQLSAKRADAALHSALRILFSRGCTIWGRTIPRVAAQDIIHRVMPDFDPMPQKRQIAMGNPATVAYERASTPGRIKLGKLDSPATQPTPVATGGVKGLTSEPVASSKPKTQDNWATDFAM